MESNTSLTVREEVGSVLTEWEQVSQALGGDLTSSARQHGLLRRLREIKSGDDLLRLSLVYSGQDWSLNQMGVWAMLAGVGYLSDVAVLKKLRACQDWLAALVYSCVRQRASALADLPGIRVCLRDATVINAPGSPGTDWRMHVKFDLGQQCLSDVLITDGHGGESLARLSITPGEIHVADRGHCFPSSLGAVLGKQAHFVVRLNSQNLPLWREPGQRFDLSAWLKTVVSPSEQRVQIQTPQGTFQVRLLACPLPPQAAEAARRKVREAARKKHYTPSQDALLAASFFLLITDLPSDPWSMTLIFTLYRLRWQVELQFKAYKSLLGLAHLRAHSPALARTYLFGKLLLILLLESLSHQVALRHPDWFLEPQHPVSAWRLTACLQACLTQLLVGPLSFTRYWACLPALERYFRCSPRVRQSQLAWGRALWEHLSCRFPLFGC
jgi:hypothetical protein